ncbi:MAG TPA: hypothetical protein VK762_07020 [Polyangiaceae bacterium]|jgi:hypothetical protein|nr:hypothetical protein [Polyangiaceae bacterium]
MHARSRLLVLTWVGCCALVSSGFIACSSDDSANPADLGNVDASMQVPPGPDDDDAEAEGGGRDSTVADAPEGDSTIADGPTEAMVADEGVQEGAADAADGGPDAADAGEGGADAADGGPDGSEGGGDAGEGGADADAGPQEAGTDGGPEGGLTSVGLIRALGGSACAQCAIDNDCLDPTNDMPTCETTTGISVSGSPDPGVARSTLCFSTLTCALQTNCFQNDSVIGCYCGTIAQSSCSTSHANGPCKTQVEDGYESTDLNVILGTPGNTDTGSDVAVQIVECLSLNNCGAVCSFADAGP